MQAPRHCVVENFELPPAIRNWRDDWKLTERTAHLGEFKDLLSTVLGKFQASNNDSLEFPPLDDPVFRHMIHLEANRLGYHTFSHGVPRRVTVFKKAMKPSKQQLEEQGAFKEHTPSDVEVLPEVRDFLKQYKGYVDERAQKEFSQKVDDWLKKFKESKGNEFTFPPVHENLRRIIHEKAEFFGLTCLSFGFGERRSPVVYKEEFPSRQLALTVFGAMEDKQQGNETSFPREERKKQSKAEA